MAYLDGKLVAFGTVLEGMDVVYLIDRCGSMNGTPKWSCLRMIMISSRVTIADSGEIKEQSIGRIESPRFVCPTFIANIGRFAYTFRASVCYNYIFHQESDVFRTIPS